ncbi:MAG: hypothetical protein H7Y31_11195 [Chitinophagaceae bacterium]|nr:hypothetical protein [Chitinophagaceae bacterium]
MHRNSMFYDTHRTKICKDIYRPSSNLTRFIKSVFAVIMVGQSSISNTSYAKRKPN